MELGNMMFGNSRGEYEIPRCAGYETELNELFDAIDDVDNHFGYGVHYENEVFFTMPYYWGDCTCGNDDENCTEECLLVKPNFIYKPTGYNINWYKYPLRDAYQSENLSLDEFKKIIKACIDSLKLGEINEK